MRQVTNLEDLCAHIGFWPYWGFEYVLGNQKVVGKRLTEEESLSTTPDYTSYYPVVISARGLLYPLVNKLMLGNLSQITIQTKSGTTQWKVATPTQPTVH